MHEHPWWMQESGVFIPRDPNYALNKAQKEAEAKAKAVPEKPKVPTEDKITLRVVDDQTGRSVPGVLLDIQVPGGFIEPDHETRRDGLVESLGLESGECEVSCDIKDLTLKNTLGFVGVGDNAIEKAPEGFKGTGIPDPEPNNRYRITFVEKYRVKVGDTLKGVSQTVGVDLQMLAHFNWELSVPLTAENYAHAESYFNSADIIYIPKKWSQKGLLTNQHHTIRVQKTPKYIEDDLTKRAPGQKMVLPYNRDGEFDFLFENGYQPQFVYLDIGCWLDNADGKNTRHRNFALICGPHIYLCEFDFKTMLPSSRVKPVQEFFHQMFRQGLRAKVVSYACANTQHKKLKTDNQVYVFLGDLHLPPRSWRNGRLASGDPDIFQNAGTDLLIFLNALRKFEPSLRQSIHFIQTGDMLELWVGKSYLFKQGANGPEWIDYDAYDKALNWTRDVVDGNPQVINVFRTLETSFGETVFLWGNHDDYLQDPKIAERTPLPERLEQFSDSSGEIFCHHGHQFDPENYDNRNGGNFLVRLAGRAPQIRRYENQGRGIIHPGHEEREGYVLGAALTQNEQHKYRGDALSTYIMAHTHIPSLIRLTIIKE